MQTTIRKKGSSAVIMFSEPVLAASGFNEGDSLELKVSDGKIILSPVVPSYTLEKLLKCSPAVSVELDDTDLEWLNDRTAGKEKE